ncbi:hypothetical protein KR009_004970, partial [Drosophila setifemur]
EEDYHSKPIVVRDYIICGKIGAGAFGEIFRAKHRLTGDFVAIKMERNATKQPQLLFEYKLYSTLLSCKGFPRVLDYMPNGPFNMLVMELLGPSLEDLFCYCSRQFSLKTVLMLADQVVERLWYMHSVHFLHRDVKPENFLMGFGGNRRRVYIIDLGLAKTYWDAVRDVHVPPRKETRFTGTARYASINALVGGEQSRRDDMESLGYMLIYFLRGSLPWQGLKSVAKKQRHELIAEKKASTRLDDLCQGFPDEFHAYISYCRSLGFEERPNYLHIRRSFADLLHREKLVDDGLYDW